MIDIASKWWEFFYNVYVQQTTKLYTMEYYSFVCQLYNKAEKLNKKK